MGSRDLPLTFVGFAVELSASCLTSAPFPPPAPSSFATGSLGCRSTCDDFELLPSFSPCSNASPLLHPLSAREEYRYAIDPSTGPRAPTLYELAKLGDACADSATRNPDGVGKSRSSEKGLSQCRVVSLPLVILNRRCPGISTYHRRCCSGWHKSCRHSTLLPC